MYNVRDDTTKNTHKVMVNVEIQGKKLEFGIDMGSPITAISENYLNTQVPIRVNLNKTDRMLKSYTGGLMIPRGSAKVTAMCRGKAEKIELFVMSGDSAPIMGLTELRKFGIVESERESPTIAINNIKTFHWQTEFKNVFSNKIGTYKCNKMELLLKDGISPVYKKARPIPYDLRGKVENELERLVREEILKPVESSEWATPIVVVTKKNGEIRICGDFKVILNPYIEIDRHSIPKIQDILGSMGNCTVQSKLDISEAYHQIQLSLESIPYTTINIHKGLFLYIRSPFGIASIPGWFQREMEQLLGNIEGVSIFFDDIRVSGKNEQEHDERLRTVLEHLQMAGLTLNFNKCEWSKNSINFLG